MSAPAHPPLAQSHFASGLIGFTPSSKTRTLEMRGVDASERKRTIPPLGKVMA
jgi:hypothetical protein